VVCALDQVWTWLCNYSKCEQDFKIIKPIVKKNIILKLIYKDKKITQNSRNHINQVISNSTKKKVQYPYRNLFLFIKLCLTKLFNIQ